VYTLVKGDQNNEAFLFLQPLSVVCIWQLVMPVGSFEWYLHSLRASVTLEFCKQN